MTLAAAIDLVRAEEEVEEGLVIVVARAVGEIAGSPLCMVALSPVLSLANSSLPAHPCNPLILLFPEGWFERMRW